MIRHHVKRADDGLGSECPGDITFGRRLRQTVRLAASGDIQKGNVAVDSIRNGHCHVVSPDGVVDFGLGQPLLRSHFYYQCPVSRPCNGVGNGIGIILVRGVYIFVQGRVAQTIRQHDRRMCDEQSESNRPEYSDDVCHFVVSFLIPARGQ